jgi:hypothetical protein
LSEPNFIGALVENGSCCWVTESKAIARVEVSWLMRMGAADCAETFFDRWVAANGNSTLTVITISVRTRECERAAIAEFA